MDNKERLKEFLKAATLIAWGSISIGTTATALNSFPGAFLSVVSVLNLAATGLAMYRIVKKNK